MQDLNGLGDNTEDFIDFSHQDGARQYRRTQGLRDYKKKHESQHKADHRSSHPNVYEVEEKMREKGSSVQKRCSQGKDRREEKASVRFIEK